VYCNADILPREVAECRLVTHITASNTVLQMTTQVTYPNKKVDHEENVEGKIDLLRGAVRPFLTRLHRLSKTQIYRQIA